LLESHIERESKLRKVFEEELSKHRTLISQTKQKNSELYDKIDQKKNWFEKTDYQKAEKWKL
jgi:hypothetical protein